jgi:hypothetical protein
LELRFLQRPAPERKETNPIRTTPKGDDKILALKMIGQLMPFRRAMLFLPKNLGKLT